MKRSTNKKKTATKLETTEQLVEPVSITQATAKPRHAPTAARRVSVQYTPRIPTARCPWC